jgi:hypothetical protein
MTYTARRSWTLRAAFAAVFLLAGSTAYAQLVSGTDVNQTRKTGDDNECAISKNPTNPNQLFAFCNTSGPGLVAMRSTDGGATWTYPDPADKTIADGDAGQGPAACCDPTSAWDTFGNLYLTYIDAGVANIVTLLSTDGGATFTNLASFAGSVDQPTVVAANTTQAGVPVAVWVVWNQSGSMVARGAAVTGLGAVGAFGALQNIPGTAGCSFGDVAIAPSGAVVQACQNPTGGQGPARIFVNTDPDGVGGANFGAAVQATTTNVGGFDFIPAQNARSVDAEAGLAFDNHVGSPHFGRLYLVYTEETVDENNDLDIMLRFSDDNGANWSAPIRVNDDPAAPVRSQFLPKISVDDTTGNIGICWHDARNSATNNAMQPFCTVASPSGATPTFLPNQRLGNGTSSSNGAGVEFGDYSGLDFLAAALHPIWADTSNSTGDNPNLTANFDAVTNRVTGGPATPQIQVPGPIDLGATCGGVTNRATLNVCNTGKDDLIVTAITSSNPMFTVAAPSAGFPVVISHDFCFPFGVAFQGTTAGPQTGTLTIASNDPAHPSTTTQVLGAGTSPEIRVTGSTAFGVGSAWRPAEKTVRVCNTGACNLTVASATVSCTDFTAIANPFPATVSHDSCLDLTIGFTPSLPGSSSCQLTVTSNAPGTPTVTRTLTGHTPPFLSIHAGLAEPHGSLHTIADLGSTINVGFVYPFTPNWAWDLRVGRTHFDERPGQSDTTAWMVLANARYTFNPAALQRVFVNAGGGLYHFDPGSREAGFNLGAGANFQLNRRFAIEGTYNYHEVFTPSPNLRFSQFQAGLLVSF